MFAVCCALRGARCSLGVDGCLLYVVWRVMLIVRCVLCVACGLLAVWCCVPMSYCVLYVACRLLVVVWRVLLAVPCLLRRVLFVICCAVRDVCCFGVCSSMCGVRCVASVVCCLLLVVCVWVVVLRRMVHFVCCVLLDA